MGTTSDFRVQATLLSSDLGGPGVGTDSDFRVKATLLSSERPGDKDWVQVLVLTVEHKQLPDTATEDPRSERKAFMLDASICIGDEDVVVSCTYVYVLTACKAMVCPNASIWHWRWLKASFFALFVFGDSGDSPSGVVCHFRSGILRGNGNPESRKQSPPTKDL